MTGTFKNIPIQTVTADISDAEMHSCAEAEPYALRVIGDSMAPEFVDGCIIVVDPAMPPQHEAYVVIDYQGETTFRQFIVEGERKFLKALNDDAHPAVELVEKYSVRGVVIQRAGRRRKEHKHYY
jgi:SOS-response transcriptional repressor LexA